ncbi:hypothetical protein ALP60_100542 [Pseudomonas savastanoi]|uniref:Uncharacterized protein n=2 Tax=Pseudomonas syringae group TaxID=136849 RepID=A0A3M5GCH3_PSESS|nr:hypothetical protein ALP60_100542 [Pseudomonas savastanoi]RMU28333.1 hypothetical protein ALP31_100456 [Pseudomonas amygdali pv. morsprunorum]
MARFTVICCRSYGFNPEIERMQEQLDQLRLPKAVQGAISDLVRALEATSTRADVEAEGALQIEYIHSLETSRKLRPADAEALYIIFDDAVQARLQALSD